MNKILVVAPHPDDEVLGVGGTIKKKVSQGHEVFVAIVTNATKSDPVKFTEEKLLNVRNEAKQASNILGVERIFFEDFPAPALDQFPGHIMADAISKIIKKIKPDTLYIPFRGDIHNDHKAVFDACMVAARPVDNYSVKRIYAYETMSETEWAYPFAGESFVPNKYESLTQDEFNIKVKAMACYNSQLKTFPNPRSIEALESLSKYRGSTINVEKAEAFMVIREIE